jgi:hypothetical protein
MPRNVVTVCGKALQQLPIGQTGCLGRNEPLADVLEKVLELPVSHG